MGRDACATLFYGWLLTYKEVEAIVAEVWPTIKEEGQDDDDARQYVLEYLECWGSPAREPLGLGSFYDNEKVFLMVSSTRRAQDWDGPNWSIRAPTEPEPIGEPMHTSIAAIIQRPGAWYLVPEFR